MNPALWQLLGWSLRGRVLRWTRLVRKPKYLVGLVVGLGYYVLMFTHGTWRAHAGRGGPLPEGAASTIHLVSALGMALVLTWGWLWPRRESALPLTEADLVNLLPAPIPRRDVVRFALLKAQPAIAIGALVVCLFAAVRPLPERLARFPALWAVLTLWYLHGQARIAWFARLRELPPAAALRRRIALWTLLAAFWLAVGAGVAQVAGPVMAALNEADRGGEALSGVTLMTAVSGATQGGVLRWVLAPLLVVSAPLMPGSFAVHALAWLALLGLLALHEQWIVNADVQFEEAALQRARRLAERPAFGWERRRQRLSVKARRRHPFRLPPLGRPEIAVAWKNLASYRVPWRVAALVATGALFALLVVTLLLRAPTWLVMTEYIAGGYALVGVPLMLSLAWRNDLRTDLRFLEALRTWPVEGWRLVAAEILAPAALSLLYAGAGAGVVLVGAIASAMFGPRHAAAGGLPHAVLPIAATVAALPLEAGIAVLAFTVQNLIVLLFPGWVHLGKDRPVGAAVAGQRMVLLLGFLIILLLGLSPGLLVIGGILLAQHLADIPFSPWELPAFGLIAAAPLAIEAALLIRWGGRIWEGLDPSQELLDTGT